MWWDWMRGLYSADDLYLVAGAVLAGVVGYATDVIRSRREVIAKRAVLLRMLAYEIDTLGSPSLIPPYLAFRENYSPPIQLVALPQLLDGNTLNYQSHTELLHELHMLHRIVASYNDFASITNQFHERDVLNKSQEMMLKIGYSRYQLVVMSRDRLMELLPDDAKLPVLNRWKKFETESDSPDSNYGDIDDVPF